MFARVGGRGVAGWILYDFANVLSSLTVVTLYFPLWIVDEAGGEDADYALASSIAMAIVFVFAPFLGSLSDRVKRRMPMLIAFTLGSAVSTMFLGSGGLKRAQVLFVISNVLYLLALLVYDTLLPSVSSEENRGRVSGWGFAAGFGGALAGIAIGMAVLALDEHAHSTIFVIAGALFLLLAIPCFYWVRERPNPRSHGIDSRLVRETMTEVRSSVRDARQVNGLARFLVGRFFYSDATNTAVIFMSIYATREVGMSDFQVQLVLLVGIIVGPAGALWAGSSVDRAGPKRTLNVMLTVWGIALLAAALVPIFNLPAACFWFVAPLVGFGLGGTATTDRAYLVRLAPPDQVGRFLGLYAMVGRFAAILSPLLWVFVADVLGLGRPVAVLTLVFMIGLAGSILNSINDSRRAWPVESALTTAGQD